MRPFLPKLARDLAFSCAVAVLWLFDRRLASTDGALVLVLGVLTGAFTGALGFLVHEWGHLAGALAARSSVAATGWRSPLLFSFDVASSTRRQHLAMSAGGYGATSLAAAAILLFVPWDSTSGRVSMALMSIGVALTVALEVPRTARALRSRFSREAHPAGP